MNEIFLCPKCKKGRAFRIGREHYCGYLECLKCEAKIWLSDTADYSIRQEFGEENIMKIIIKGEK